MNAQVLLLTLVTSLFMAAWDGDQAVMKSALARRAQQRNVSIATSHQEHSPQNTATQRSIPGTAAARDAQYPGHIENSAIAPSTSLHSTEVMSASQQIPLPEGIPAGDYQAVSQTGQSLRIRVDHQSNTVSAPVSVLRDLYISDTTGGTRWFLVRIQSPAAL